MRLVIAVSSHLNKYRVAKIIEEAIEIFKLKPTIIISEGVNGTDSAAEIYSRKYGIYFNEYKVELDIYGKKANLVKNKKMIKAADSLLLVWDGNCKDCENILEEANSRELDVYEIRIKYNAKPKR